MNEETIELLVERLASRIYKANEFFLIKIGESVKKIRGLTPTQAHQLIQILKYNGNYEEIVNEILRLTNLNIQDIDAIFNEMAKKNYEFAEQFYKYRGVEYVPYNQNKALIRQVNALASITKQEMFNYARATNLGYSIKDLQGNVKFVGLKETYDRILDTAVLNVGTGVDTFDNAMSKIMKEVGGSGLKTVDYASGRSIRLDSMARMHLKGALRTLHNEIQKQVGEEFGANMIEISVHEHPAEDHLVQGHQFLIEEFNKLQNGQQAKDLEGEVYTLDHNDDGKFRPISTMNCYHYVFYGIVGVSKPNYSKQELDEIIKNNEKGAIIDGKHYTNYEITQLQRSFERKIRKQKDIQILAKESGNKELVKESQDRITQLTHKYKQLSDVSGLPTRMDRLKVSQYRRISTKKL